MLFEKNAAQHFADLAMLEGKKIIPAFINPVSDERKEVECAQVDGIYDEGPSHLEVQYWWTLRHFETQSGMVLVTSRNSGATIVMKTE